MFVGHALLAFAAVGVVAVRLTDRRTALVLASVAAAYAAVPDVDILYAPVGVGAAVVTGTVDPFALAGTFWATGNVVHRAITHSLIVAPAVAVAVALLIAARRAGRRPLAAPALLAGVGVVAWTVSGPLGGAVATAFALASLAVAEVVARRTTLRPRAVGAVAFVGLASHPFGDLLSGRPPALAYPFETAVVAERVALHPDPTVHLLGAFAVELATVWAGFVVLLALSGRFAAVGPLRTARRGALGTGYAASVFVLPAPTLDLSYPFVFSVIAVGLVGLLPRVVGGGPKGRGELSAPAVPAGSTDVDVGGLPAALDARLPGWESGTATALAAVTVAWAAYLVAYLVVA